MSAYERLSPALASVAIIVSVVSLALAHRAHRDRERFDLSLYRLQSIEEAKVIVEKNLASMNGIMNSKALEPTHKSPSFLVEVAKLNAENRDAYSARRHHFGEESRSKIDERLNDIELLYPKFQNASVDEEDIMMIFSLSELIRDAIEEELRAVLGVH